MKPPPAGADDAYEITPEGGTEIPADWQLGAVYNIELPCRCPFCREPIRELRALRLTRGQVSFTSTLPRGGRVLVCPLCEKIISAELSGIL
jgi:hypothetical protein